MSRDYYETTHVEFDRPTCAVCLIDAMDAWEARESTTTVFGTAVCSQHVERGVELLTRIAAAALAEMTRR